MKYITVFFVLITLLGSNWSCTSAQNQVKEANDYVKKVALTEDLATAYFASGCFWCVEAIFESVEGVAEAISGYAGGTKADATYEKVSGGRTDHAEAVLVYYDAEVVSYETLLTVFFGSHDPTTLNRQGPDAGTQYRSTIFYTNEAELEAAKNAIEIWNGPDEYNGKVTTTLEKLDEFFEAEAYHQDFEKRNPNYPYVRAVSIPRLNKFKKKYPDLLKKEAH